MLKPVLFFLVFVALECAGQKTSPVKAAGSDASKSALDSFSYQILSTTIKMIKLAEDPLKGPGFFMTGLQETNQSGQPVYTAPYSVAGFKATVTKLSTNRSAGTTQWLWEADINSPSQGLSLGQIETLDKKTDSLLNLLKYKEGKSPNCIDYVYSYYYKGDEQPVISIKMRFYKPLHNIKPVASDSMVAIYKPLLFNPAFAGDAANKLWGGFLAEGFTVPEIKLVFQPLFKELANAKIEAAYEAIMGLPSGVTLEDTKELMALFSDAQREGIRAMAQKTLDDFYEKERKKFKGDPVVKEEQKVQAKKGLANCAGIPEQVKDKFRVGITMQGTVNYNPFIAQVVEIDCSRQRVRLVRYGSKRKSLNETIQLSFSDYGAWVKYHEQYYRCSHCAGEGGELVTESETKVKELPFGYFSGIETKVRRTTYKTYWEDCGYCKGSGWQLLPDKTPDY